MRSEREEWLHIAAYENGQRDMILTITDLFGAGLPEDAKLWMRLTSEENQRRAREAERKARRDLPLVAVLSDFSLNLLKEQVSAELQRRGDKAA